MTRTVKLQIKNAANDADEVDIETAILNTLYKETDPHKFSIDLIGTIEMMSRLTSVLHQNGLISDGDVLFVVNKLVGADSERWRVSAKQ